MPLLGDSGDGALREMLAFLESACAGGDESVCGEARVVVANVFLFRTSFSVLSLAFHPAFLCTCIHRHAQDADNYKPRTRLSALTPTRPIAHSHTYTRTRAPAQALQALESQQTFPPSSAESSASPAPPPSTPENVTAITNTRQVSVYRLRRRGSSSSGGGGVSGGGGGGNTLAHKQSYGASLGGAGTCVVPSSQ